MSINEEIVRVPGISYSTNVRVIAQDNEQIGVIPLSQALEMAYDKDMDLVLMSAQAEVPVCRIMDYGKFCFERDKKEKENRKKQQKMDIKEVQLSCRIDTNDFNTKANHARRFLNDGDKVRVAVRFKGRQMAHQEIGLELLEKFAQTLADAGTVEKKPVLEGRTLTMFIVPLKK
ncbi:MAG: translation initiation factor IF-3 [Clostridia bacterium]|nr:translation initiation factor IF-3 [Clostridia bacterium]MBQ8399213.1 translation initiation factor IF-3 [Clostridia bacterium]